MTATVSPQVPLTGQSATSPVARPAQVIGLLRRYAPRSGGCVAVVRLQGTWGGKGDLLVDGNPWAVVQARSQLAVREALVAHAERAADARLVILTPLDTLDLGLDVRARILKHQVLEVHAWELLAELFRARAVDPRLAKLRWMADVLVELAPPGGYPPAPSGVLDLETAWYQLLGGALSLVHGAPDAMEILRWASDATRAARWRGLAPEVRQGITERFGETAGELGACFAAALTHDASGRLVPIGLACDVLWPARPVTAADRDALVAARVRLEPLLGGRTLSEATARHWAELAVRVVAEGELKGDVRLAHLGAAESLLASELKAESAVGFSTVLPAGARARAADFGTALLAAVDEPGSIGAAVAAYERFVEHTDVATDAERRERAGMALRLARVLGHEAAALPDSFVSAVRAQVTRSSWVDRARTALLGGDVVPDLARAYATLFARARAAREVENLLFAEALVAWNASPAATPSIVPIERVLELLVAPIAAARPVLVCCVDGLDLGVWRQLHADLATRGWTWWQPAASDVAPIAIAMVPSVTAMSRASLFAGTARSGNQGTEKKDFEQHPALKGPSAGGKAPVLFHKGDLGEGNALDGTVRRAIADPKQRVVGVVINAVDDWLDRSDQVLPRWSVAAIPLLEALLQEAVLAGRAVAIVSDHGHLLDHDTIAPRSGESARWRHASGDPPAPGEVVATGPRVRAVTGLDAVVLASSEALRYTGKKTGYHGGATPQEVLAPVAILSRDESGVEGWRPVADVVPSWWDGSVPTAAVAAAPVTSAASQVEAAGTPTPPAPTAPGWIDALLASPVYVSQRAMAGRTAPSDEQMRTLLTAFAARGNRLPLSVLAATLGVPEVRVRGFASAARRVLNVEGYAVVQQEPGTGTLLLEVGLLRAQFGLGGA